MQKQIAPRPPEPGPTALARRIGERVFLARKQARLTREQLAARAEVSERYLNQLEKGEANVSIGVLSRVAQPLGLALPSLLADEPASSPVAASLSYAPLAALLAGMSGAEQIEAHAVLERHLSERRRRCKGIALLGLRGAGKSTLARRLAERTGLAHVNITQRIEELAGVQVNELFNLGGADAYRNLENEAIAALDASPEPIILETAGGVVANGEAYAAILASYRTVWLKASPEEHLSRVQQQGDMRPMRGNPRALENIKTLLAAREPDYARADHTIDTSGRGVEACLDILLGIARPLIEAHGAGRA